MSRGRKVIITGVALLGFAGAVGGITLAVFTDQQTSGGSVFSTSTISLGVNPATAVVTYNGMLPGDSVTNSMVVTNNAGSAALRYAISSTATNADSKGLKDQLVLVIKTVDVTTPGAPCDDFDGTQLYSGDLDSSNGKLVGDAAQGYHTGDRTMAVGGSETLCFRASLPVSTGNAYKNATSTATFTFDAEQTANNP